MAQRHERNDAPRPAVRVLGWTILACLSVAVFLGLSRHGRPIWGDARALFLPAGILLMIQSTLLDGRRAHPMDAIPPNPLLAPAVFTCGLGVAAIGLEHLDPARAWSILAVPMIVLLGLVFLREARRGRESVLIRQTSGRLERFWVRAGMWMFGLGWPLGVLWAIGVVQPD